MKKHTFSKYDKKLLSMNTYYASIGAYDLIRPIPNHPDYTETDYIERAAWIYKDSNQYQDINAANEALIIIAKRKRYIDTDEYNSILRDTEEELENYVKIMANSIKKKH